MEIHNSFPKYKKFNPLVPVWCLTPDIPGCMHRFFDSSAISPSGRYVAVFQLPFEDRQPSPGDKGTVRIIDLLNGENKVIAKTSGWEPQLGANLNWGNDDHELFYNDVDTETWSQFSWKHDPLSGEKMKMDCTVYHVSCDGKWLISANLSKLRKTQSGYGVILPDEKVMSSDVYQENEGLFITDTSNGQCSLFISIKEIVNKVFPVTIRQEIEKSEIYAFHSKWNNQGTRLMLSIRWFEKRVGNQFNMCDHDYNGVRFAWITISSDSNEIYCAIGPDQFAKGGHHATWCPDGEHISLNLRLDGKRMRFVTVKYDGSNIREMVQGLEGSGHPTVHPCGYIITDTYLNGFGAKEYNDGTVPLRWINIKTGAEHIPVRIDVNQPCDDSALRVDPHPAWDRSWRYITFNGYENGSRRVYIADMQQMYSGEKLPPPYRVPMKKPTLARRALAYVKRMVVNG